MKKMGRPKSDNAKKKVLSIRVPDQLYSQMLAYAEQHKMEELAQVVNDTRVGVSRALNSMQEKGLLELHRGEMMIPNAEKL